MLTAHQNNSSLQNSPDAKKSKIDDLVNQDFDFSVKSLTENGIRDICDKNKQAEVKTQTFIIQAIETKVFTEDDKKKNVKQRIHLSDGTSTVIAMITEKMDKQMKMDKFLSSCELQNSIAIPRYSILKMTGNMLQTQINERKVLVFKEIPEILYTGLTKAVGKPREYEKNMQDTDYFQNIDIDLTINVNDTIEYQKIHAKDSSAAKSTVSTIPSNSNQNSAQKVESPIVDKADIFNKRAKEILNMSGDIQYTPIKSLNAFLFDWKIKARVTKKCDLKTWKNAKSEGHVMNVELIDNLGTLILATFYNDAALKYNEMLQENHVYLMSNGSVKIANKKFTSIKNDYCIVFDKSSDIKEVEDDSNIQQQGFNFVTIDEINDFEQSRTVDTVGVITQVGQLSSFQPKNGGAAKDKRSLQIADESGLAISMTLWGQNASKLEFKEGSVLAIRGAKVSDYGGKTLNSGHEHSQIFIDVDHKRTRELKQWNANRNQDGLNSVSTIGGAQGNQQSEKLDNFRLISEVVKNVSEEGASHQPTYNSMYAQPKAKFFKISGFVSHARSDDKYYYLSCPDCRRKVVDELEGFRCENCNKSFSRSFPTYIMTVKFQDATGDMYIQFARELGDQIMGMTAEEFKDAKEQLENPEEMKLFLSQQILYKAHSVVIKAQNDQYRSSTMMEGDQRIKYTAIKVAPISFKEENNMLLKRLSMYENRDNKMQTY